MTERPDPLAEPPRREPARRPGEPDPPDLTRCSAMPGGQAHCLTPPSVIAWIGCLKGEHAGPLAYCAAHAAALGGPMICAQCGGQVRVMKITSMDGVSTGWTADPPRPPDEPWRTIFTPP